jgi:soluble lytic murein transglycosylase-like protein
MTPRPVSRRPLLRRSLVAPALTLATLVALPGLAAASSATSASSAGTASLRNEHPAPPRGVALTRATVRYTVRKGESLGLIAAQFHTTAKALQSANQLRSTTIHPGQVLQVPGVAVPTRVPGKLPIPLRTSPDRLVLVPAFVSAAKEFDVPYDLLMSLAYTESGWQRSIVSADGAVGVGQLLPMTSKWVARSLLNERGLDPRDGEDNIRLSARFLAYLLEMTDGSQLKALAAYYQGHVAVLRDGVSAGGRNYATIILTNRSSFRF